MPIENSMGQSKYTPGKHDDFKVIMNMSVQMVKRILNKYRDLGRHYLYFDITAGDGGTFTEPGSPRIAQAALELCGLPYYMVLIEQDQRNADHLHSSIAVTDTVRIICGDHHVELAEFIRNPIVKQPQKWQGVLFCDTNGTEPPWELLRDFARVYRRVDLVIYMAPTNFKRFRKYVEHQRGEKLPCLSEQIDTIGKKQWIVREPRGQHQWTFYIGSNWDNYPDYHRRGYYRLDSPAGKRISQAVSLTCEERQQEQLKNQLPLPYQTYDEYLHDPRYLVIRDQAIERSGGVCEQCHARAVSEVHHVKYPAWGTFEDNADHLIAICHECHCVIHGKDN